MKYNLTLTFVEYYVSVYPYASDEPGDLSFDQGETVLVTKKDGEWWTGVIGSRTGIFPFNYVQPPDIQVSSQLSTKIQVLSFSLSVPNRFFLSTT